MLGTTVQNLVAQVNLSLVFVHPCEEKSQYYHVFG
jgi:hypothetical protein